MHLADAHCHLQDERFAGTAGDVIARARATGVDLFVCCGSSESDWDEVARLSADPGVIPAYGLHPWYVRERTAQWSGDLFRRLRDDPRAAVGEIGLDHAIDEPRHDEQMSVFLEQLRMAAELERTVSIHCRRAYGALAQALAQVTTPRGVVIHSYSGSVEMIAPLAALGAHFSVSCTIVWPRNQRIRAAAAAIPAERLLIESDSPDLPPPPPEGQPAPQLNEPANMLRILPVLAALRGTTQDALAELTWSNACRLFRCGNLTS